MASSVVLSAATRQSLLSAQDTASLLSRTQNRLSTGKEVNSALDNPTNYFQAAALNSRVGDLTNLLDTISNGIQTIQAANTGITNIQKLVDTAKSTATQALATTISTTGTSQSTIGTATGSINITYGTLTQAVTVTWAANSSQSTILTALNGSGGANQNAFSFNSAGNLVVNGSGVLKVTGTGFQAAGSDNTSTTYIDESTYSADLSISGLSARQNLASQYNDLLTQIDQLAGDSSYNGVNLINSASTNNKLKIQFNETNTSNISIQGVDATRAGLGLSSVTLDKAGSFLLDSSINTVVTNLTNATSTLRSYSSTLGSNLTVVQNRQDFTKNLSNVLTTGASALTDADLNEEAANSQALSTRQSLAISALSLSNTAQQSVLQLLR